MDQVTIYHNPVCGKSRGALEILRERGVNCDVVEYLKQPLDRAGLGRVLDLLRGAPAWSSPRRARPRATARRMIPQVSSQLIPTRRATALVAALCNQSITSRSKSMVNCELGAAHGTRI